VANLYPPCTHQKGKPDLLAPVNAPRAWPIILRPAGDSTLAPRASVRRRDHPTIDHARTSPGPRNFHYCRYDLSNALADTDPYRQKAENDLSRAARNGEAALGRRRAFPLDRTWLVTGTKRPLHSDLKKHKNASISCAARLCASQALANVSGEVQDLFRRHVRQDVFCFPRS
jgi:hypothetical protein